MNIKKALLVTLSTGLIAITLLQTNYVKAEKQDGPEENVTIESKGSSKATVEFTIDEDNVPNLVNPLKPAQELTEEEIEKVEGEGIITGNKGPLSLDYISNIDFGSQTVNVEEKDYESTTEVPYIQVTDNRGYGEGWTISAQVEPFKNGEEALSLPGAEIYLYDGEAKSGYFDEKQSPIVQDKIKLDTDNESKGIVSADKRENDEDSAKGLGTWIISWVDENFNLDQDERNEKVKLRIPSAAATEGNHSTKINWTLTNTPTGDSK